MWWFREIFKPGSNPTGRPNLIDINVGRNIEFTGIKLLNSPYWTFNPRDMDQAYFHDFEIEVDIWSQKHLNDLFADKKGLSLRIPIFPLNTDGIDPSGRNILIERVNITNFDDAVAVKP